MRGSERRKQNVVDFPLAAAGKLRYDIYENHAFPQRKGGTEEKETLAMNRIGKRFTAALLALLLALMMTACGIHVTVTLDTPAPTADPAPAGIVTETPAPKPISPTAPDSEDEPIAALPDADGAYYDVESVVKYLDAYGVLPSNYITKDEARDLGWSGGAVDRYLDGAAIGGDRFGNREGLLPKAQGRTYSECDIDTLGENGRGAKRLVFSSDGLYFYTDDHYESFTELTVTEGGDVRWK